jgi:acyl dehydratase
VAERRGAIPRFIEDVSVGEQLPPLLKGPLTISVLVGFLMGWGSPLTPTNRLLSQQLKVHPAIKLVHPENGIAENYNAAHLDGAFARMSGLPEAYDYGCQRVCWLAHLLGDWMGDAGFLAELDSKIRRPNIMGDVSWLAGEVVAVDLEAATATIKLSITNQLGEVNTTGVGRVRLPRKGA